MAKDGAMLCFMGKEVFASPKVTGEGGGGHSCPYTYPDTSIRCAQSPAQCFSKCKSPGDLAEHAGSDPTGAQWEWRFQVSDEAPGGSNAAGP